MNVGGGYINLAESKRTFEKNCVILINYIELQTSYQSIQWLFESIKVIVKEYKIVNLDVIQMTMVYFRSAIFSSAKSLHLH